MIKEFYDSGEIKTMISEDFKTVRIFRIDGTEVEKDLVAKAIKDCNKIQLGFRSEDYFVKHAYLKAIISGRNLVSK